MAVPGDYLFFALAGVCQAVIGLTFLVRKSDHIWAKAAGLLFVLNGGISIANFFTAYWSSGEDLYVMGRRIGHLLDPATSYIILYLALAYPSPVGGNRKIIMFSVASIGLAHFAYGLLRDGLLDRLYQAGTLGGPEGILYVAFVQEIAWAAVLIRWSRAVMRSEVNWKFSLLACALAVRASHVGIVSFGTRINKLSPRFEYFFDLPFAYIWQFFISMVPVIALIYALFVLLAPPSVDGRTRASEIFLGFLFFGIVEALISMASLTGADWARAPFLFVDSLLLRPVLVWGSLYGMPTRNWRIAGIGVFILLCISAFVPTGLNVLAQLEITGGPAWFFSTLFTGAMVVLSAKFVFPLLHEKTWQPQDDRLGLQT